jgi:hypothetical protein
MKNNFIKKLFEINKLFIISFFIIASFFIAKDVFAMDIPVFSLIVSENSSGYVCSGDSISCSSLSSIYKIEKRGENLYICPSDSIGCSPLSDSYKTKIYDEDTTYICLGSSFGCGSLSALYKLKKYDEYTTYVCSGDSIGCSSLSALFKLKKYDEYTTYACSSDSIGCSSLSAIYKFKKTDTQSSGYSEINYSDQIKIEQEKLAQLEQEQQKLTENYLNALNNLNAPQYTCPANSTLNGNICSCNDGYVSNESTCITYTQNCQTKYGVNSYGDKQYCRCSAGYEWNTTQTTCVRVEVKPTIPQPVIRPAEQKINNSKEEVQKITKSAEKLVVKNELTKEDVLTASTSEKANIPKEEIKREIKSGFFVQIFESIKSFFWNIFK